MFSLTTFLIAVAVVIIVALAFYAGRLLQQVATQERAQQEVKSQQQKGLVAFDTKALDSVLIITRAMREEQCEFGEGCWRLSILLSSLKTIDSVAVTFPTIFKFYDGIKHLAILDDRKKLTKKERMQQDLTRMKLESDLHEDIKVELVSLEQYTRAKLDTWASKVI